MGHGTTGFARAQNQRAPLGDSGQKSGCVLQWQCTRHSHVKQLT
jgi:hypothetical protein